MKAVVLAAGVTFLAMAGAAMAASAGDPVRGKTVFARCVACHDVSTGANKLGPSLKGVVGRKAGAAAGFKYSPALKGKGVVWTRDALDGYLSGPVKYVPGTKMTLTVAKDQDRADLIAYLATLR